MASGKQKEWRALIGMDFVNVDGEETRVEAGDKIEGMPEDELRHQINLKNAKGWKERDTEGVQRPGDVPVVVTGVLSRHADLGKETERIVLKGVETDG